MKHVKTIVLFASAIFFSWLLFGGGELNSPSLGIKALLWIAQ